MSRSGAQGMQRKRREWAALDELYASLPTIECQEKCWDSCGPIGTSRAEWERVIKTLGYEPKAGPEHLRTLTCPLLAENRCTIYSIRPLICRLWGIVESMPCPWGCKPERYLTHIEGHEFLLQAELISQPHEADEIERMRRFMRAEPEFVSSLMESVVQPPVKTHE